MNLIFDYRVLSHRAYTGVENYAKHILEHIKNKCFVTTKPYVANKYFAHFRTHFILPFKKGDILFCPANIAPLFVPGGKKLVLTIHDVAFLTFPESFSAFFRIYYQLVVPFNIKRADSIITVSRYSKKEIEKYYPASIGKIKVVYLGVDFKYKVLPDIKKKKQILYVGSINERKNFTGVLKTFNLMKNSGYKLIVAGDFNPNFSFGHKTKELLLASENNKNIQFAGHVSDEELVRLYNESELLVFPSFCEGFGLPVLEAMACGTPVVCSNRSSLPEVGGDAVLYCDPDKIEDIKDKIELIITDKTVQEDMIRKGLERVKMFTWRKSTDKHMEIFGDL